MVAIVCCCGALSSQGVEQIQPSQLEANCDALSDLKLEWDFRAYTWRAQFVDGPLQGVSRHMSVQDLNRHVWAILKGKEKVEGFLAHASANARKAAAQVWVILWAEAALSNDVDAFVAECHIADEICTPSRGEKVPGRLPKSCLTKSRMILPESCLLERCLGRLPTSDSTAVAALTLKIVPRP